MDDLEIVLMMMDGKEDGLRALLDRFGPKVKGYLHKRYGDVLSPAELDEAFYRAAYKAWNKIDTYDESRGTVGAWFLRIGQICAIDIIRRESRFLHDDLETISETEIVVDPTIDLDLSDGSRARKIKKAFKEAVSKLPPVQKSVIEADLAADEGRADAARLAELHATTAGSIRVSRNKAKKTLREALVGLVETELGRKR